MSKAILVIDKPESCTSCLLGIYNKKWFCLDTNKDIDICDRYNIPEWCPLKPMPQKKNTDKLQGFGNSQILWTDKVIYQNEGWNACLNEILGETE